MPETIRTCLPSSSVSCACRSSCASWVPAGIDDVAAYVRASVLSSSSCASCHPCRHTSPSRRLGACRSSCMCASPCRHVCSCVSWVRSSCLVSCGCEPMPHASCLSCTCVGAYVSRVPRARGLVGAVARGLVSSCTLPASCARARRRLGGCVPASVPRGHERSGGTWAPAGSCPICPDPRTLPRPVRDAGNPVITATTRVLLVGLWETCGGNFA